ncbi:MAG: DNA alkylation repair protein [Firmicutes bacterium]|nr:DNA alkylation repair protein [Bacillota bacterium]
MKIGDRMYEEILRIFEVNRNEDNSFAMEKYMKNKFKFLGIKRPLRNELQKPILKEMKELDWTLIELLWKQDEREYQYFAIDILDKLKKNLVKEDILRIKKLIEDKSWWDTVDLLASKIVGQLCKSYPEIKDEYIKLWMKSDNIWIVRTTLLYQLKYKNDLDTNILEETITINKDSNEFFIDKAIGWILRQYSKVNPEWVRKFISNNSLSKLSVREGSKYI